MFINFQAVVFSWTIYYTIRDSFIKSVSCSDPTGEHYIKIPEEVDQANEF